MSQNMTKEAALDCVSQKVYVPQFMSKLASLGVEPRNEVELTQLLELAASLNARGYRPQKTAAAGNPFLAKLLEQENKQRTTDPNWLKQASLAALSHDSELADAAQALSALPAAA